jgi:hypothetical protein
LATTAGHQEHAATVTELQGALEQSFTCAGATCHDAEQ